MFLGKKIIDSPLFLTSWVYHTATINSRCLQEVLCWRFYFRFSIAPHRLLSQLTSHSRLLAQFNFQAESQSDLTAVGCTTVIQVELYL